MVNKLVIIGPAWPLRGGLAAFDEKLAICFSEKGIQSSIHTFSLQYPSLLFPGKTQYSTQPAPQGINIKATINSINPFNWMKVGWQIMREKPDLIIVRYWIPFLGPCLGTILKIVHWNRHTKVISIVDNMIPHEKRLGDTLFTKYFASSIDGFVTMSEKVKNDVKLFSHKPTLVSPHPIFDHFGSAIPTLQARTQLGFGENDKIILFFGYIRKYKGLDLLIQAMKDIRIQQLGIRLLVVGEFYDAAQPYMDLVNSLALQNQITFYDQFVPDQEVTNYVSAADFIIQPYKNATQSGVTPLAYHFSKPMLVTNVGGLADTVPHLKVGVVTEPTSEDIANGIVQLYDLGAAHFLPYIQEERKKYTWEQMTEKFLALHQQL
ncbi:MAG: glycosyltransferase [Chitinophagaceae bacterium]|nr:MAG: glycosyltransferase [Chitinophagaceae bacterium]